VCALQLAQHRVGVLRRPRPRRAQTCVAACPLRRVPCVDAACRITEGDHIKVTASKYPFPTVCHDKQSTDWFHSISRTLKWNERERQKSFVVVEEGPEKKQKKENHVATERPCNIAAENDDEDEEQEDEEDDEDEMEEKFDIDDLSDNSSTSTPETTAASVVRSSTHHTLETARDKVHEQRADALAAQRAAEVLLSSQQPRSGPSSGVDSPSRYMAGEPPHPPPRHVQFSHAPQQPHTHSHVYAHAQHLHGALREDARTPTAGEHRRATRSRSRGRPDAVATTPRAFAVYGHDESDSAPSDTDL
jgi:NAD+ kinase